MGELSIVLISRNQAWNITRLIESALRNTVMFGSPEIVLVDSASTDGTAEIAGLYPISVLRLSPHQRLTPAAGRYIGFRHTSGELVLFLDGDMELHAGWLEKAVQLLRECPDLGAVTGHRVDLLANADGTWPAAAPVRPYAGAVKDVPFCRSSGVYRRHVLDRVGPFNPYLYCDEEPELCLRIRRAGYRIVAIDEPMAFHYTFPRETFAGVLRRRRLRFYFGHGQSLRYNLGTRVFWPYIKERGFGFAPLIALLTGVATLLWSIEIHHWYWFGAWTLLLACILLADAFRKHSGYRMLTSVLKRLLILEGTVRGFLVKPLDPASYPDAPDVLRWHVQARHPGQTAAPSPRSA